MAQRRHPSNISDARLVAALVKYVPPIIARSIVERARREAATGPDVSWTDPNGLLDRISVGVRLFAAPEQQSAVLREITDLAAADVDSESAGASLLDDAAPASTLKPSSHRMWERPVEGARDRASDSSRDRPAESGRERVFDSSRERTMEVPRSVGGLVVPSESRNVHVEEPVTTRRDNLPPATPSPTPAAMPISAPRRDTDVAGVFGAQTRRTPVDGPPASRGVFPTTPRAASSSSPRIVAQRPERSTQGVSQPVIPPPPPSVRDVRVSGSIEIRSAHESNATPTPIAGLRRTVASTSDRAEAREITITLSTEHDIPRARQVAREICETLGTRALTQQRLVTIVSELGRNMVLYAGGGKITLRPPLSSARRVVVLAVDQGPGIANLQDIMSGRYKSRSGLGLGIVGTKRLADAFHIETGRNGTAISVEVIV